MKTAFASLALAAVAVAIESNDLDFINFVATHGKTYSSVEEYNLRKEIFLAKDLLIKQHMSRPANFSLGHNKFSDRSELEMSMLLGEKQNLETNAYCKPPASTPNVQSPSSVNWVEAGMTTPVKDQGSCGSCWTFATTSTVESANAIAGNKLVSLAEQQLVACVTADNGCGGGMTYDAYTYLQSHKAYLEADWAYLAADSECTYDESKASDVTLDTYVCVGNNPTDMKAAVALKPVAISIDAGSSVFHNYTGGVLDSTACGVSTNHAVSIVGYGNDSDSGLDYWLVRNSWGSSWGVDGFIKIAMSEGDGICAINHRPLYPIVA